MRRPRFILPFALAALVLAGSLAALPAAAAWTHDPSANLPVCRAANSQIYPGITSDGAGGAYVTWTDYRVTGTDIYVQHVLASGAVDPAWPVDGLAVCSATGAQQRSVMVPDGSGGVLLAWSDARSGTDDIYAQHVLASGAVDPAWPANGRALCTAANAQTMAAIVTDGAGGAIVAWQDGRPAVNQDDIYAQHVLASGAVDPGWPADGRALCVASGYQSNATIVTDGAGGAVVVWADNRGANSDIYAQHVTAAGAADAAWPANGVALVSNSFTQQSPAAIPDGAGGALVTWADYRSGSTFDIYVNHVVATGVVDGGWLVEGRALCVAANNQLAPAIASDGAGGAIVAWYDYRAGATSDVYAQHIGPSGTVDPAWPTDGRALCTAAGAQTGVTILADGAGGAYVAWQDPRLSSSEDLYAHHVLASGAADPEWPSDGRAVCTASGAQYWPFMVADATGGVLMAWYDYRSGGFDVYAQRIGPFGQLGSPEPHIASVRDVPNDEGGQVRVAWDASWLDLDASHAVTRYDLYRAIPASVARAALARGARLMASPLEAAGARGGILVQRDGARSYYWDYLDTRTATHFLTGYGVAVPTLGDSMGSGNPLTAFMVVALDTDGSRYWMSAPDSGYSVDDLAPVAPAPFTGHYADGSAVLHWAPNAEADLAGYQLHRGSSAAFVPGPSNLVATLEATDFVDAVGQPCFYKLAAVDAHGNQSAFTLLLPNGTADVAPAAEPVALALAMPAPNPARTEATLRFSLSRAGAVRLAVHDVSGRRVRTLIAGHRAAGAQEARWDLRGADGAPVAAGLYFVRLEAEGLTLGKRLVVTD